jgi:hypothetical protein
VIMIGMVSVIHISQGVRVAGLEIVIWLRVDTHRNWRDYISCINCIEGACASSLSGIVAHFDRGRNGSKIPLNPCVGSMM